MDLCDNDFAAASHWLGGQDTARLAWFENTDGKGTAWTMHSLSTTGLYSHGVILADFDNDKDLERWNPNGRQLPV